MAFKNFISSIVLKWFVFSYTVLLYIYIIRPYVQTILTLILPALLPQYDRQYVPITIKSLTKHIWDDTSAHAVKVSHPVGRA